MKSLFSKRSPLNVQLTSFLFLALVLLMLDINYQPFKTVRYYLETIISPLYYISNVPRETAESLMGVSQSLSKVREENVKLTQELLNANSELALLKHFKSENARLRGLLNSPARKDEQKMATEVLLDDMDSYISYIALNKGKSDGVYEGQPIVDSKGVVGQVYQISQNTSRGILICDRQHAIPVQIVRNDLRMIAVGNGCENDLTLSFLSNNIDIKVGDTLVTSGLGGRFPEGYPVAMISSVKLDTNNSTPLISATPIADLKRLRYLLLLSSKEGKKTND